MKYELLIQSKDKVYRPIIEGNVTWETERIGQPGKLSFNVVKDDLISFKEGDLVTFKLEGKEMFLGFIFAKERDKEQIIKVTAYDQLRYLKNKDTYIYKKMKASDVVSKIAKDFNLQIGTIVDTEYVIATRIRENMTLFDIIYDALDLTLMNKRKMYVLYDAFGKLTLKDVESMKVSSLVVGDETNQNFSYKTDIDSDTYNKVKLSKDNEKTGKIDVYIAQDGSKMNEWGVLQYYEKVNEETNIKAKAEALLKLKNRINRGLSIKDCLGDLRVRAGTSVMVLLEDIGDISVRQYMLVEKCKHEFGNDEHWMTLDLRGDI